MTPIQMAVQILSVRGVSQFPVGVPRSGGSDEIIRQSTNRNSKRGASCRARERSKRNSQRWDADYICQTRPEDYALYLKKDQARKTKENDAITEMWTRFRKKTLLNFSRLEVERGRAEQEKANAGEDFGYHGRRNKTKQLPTLADKENRMLEQEKKKPSSAWKRHLDVVVRPVKEIYLNGA